MSSRARVIWTGATVMLVVISAVGASLLRKPSILPIAPSAGAGARAMVSSMGRATITTSPGPATDPQPSPSSAVDMERRAQEIGRAIAAQMPTIKRLRPKDFRELPAPVSAELDRRGCTIPQTAFIRRPHNVVRGRFMTTAGRQWAALCSVGDVSSILMIDMSGRLVAELDRASDERFMQGNGDDTFVFSREITKATPQGIAQALAAYGEPDHPLRKRVLDHDGIEQAFVGKASTVFYWTGGEWLSVLGSD